MFALFFSLNVVLLIICRVYYHARHEEYAEMFSYELVN